MRVVVLVPRRAGIADRDRLWEFVSEWWATYHPEWPVYVGESPGGPFNRGAAINAAAREAGDWDVALVVDADVVCDPGQVEEAVRVAAATGRMTFPFTRYRALGEQMTRRVLDGFGGDWSKGAKASMVTHVSSVQAVPRTLWDLVDGFDERCRGWGHDDTIFAHCCRTLGGGIERIDGTVWHLYHRPSTEAKVGQPGHRASEHLAKRYFAAVTPEACAALIAERRVDAVAVMVLTHGRRDCIIKSVLSAQENLQGAPIARWVICDDSGDIEYQAWLRLHFPECELVTGKKGGFAANVRRMWDAALGTGQEWIFWLEDDFTFNAPVDLPDLMLTMAEDPDLCQIMLKRQPWFEPELAAGGFMEMHPERYTEVRRGQRVWMEHQESYWTNPHLTRRSFLAHHEWPNTAGSEEKFGKTVVTGQRRSAVWGRLTDPPLVHHMGERTGSGY
jgi:hypothetical protein